MNSKKIKVGITGSIGSGKSLFAEYLSGKGYPVLKADDISKDILAHDMGVRKKILSAFGSESFSEGKPDKKYLAEKVFSSAENVVRINQILHPPVLKKLDKEMEQHLVSNDIVFVEAALIYEADMEDMFEFVVLVTADEKSRMNWKTVNDKLSEDDFRNRNNSQIPDEEKRKRADFVFENKGTKEELFKKADLLLTLLKHT